jgi:mRNA interferase HigB
MVIFYLDRLNEFGKKRADARKSVATWKDVVQKAQWNGRQDVFRDFPRAKMIKNNRARFEIVHNTYRLIAQIHYEEKFTEIRFIGTHTEYDRIDPSTV